MAGRFIVHSVWLLVYLDDLVPINISLMVIFM